MNTINRREALKRLALLSGGALSLSTVSAIMGGCTAESGSFTPDTLSGEQNELVTVISEHIIPATDTPGAKAARVNRFIDHMLTDWNTPEERAYFLEGLGHVDEVSADEFQKPFMELSETDQVTILERLEREALDQPNPVPDTALRPFFHMMKEYTVVGYYTSEIGATKELKTNIVPGYYDACMPYNEIGRAWS